MDHPVWLPQRGDMQEPRLDIPLPEDTERLKARVAALERELEGYRRASGRSRAATRAGGWFLVRVVLGGDLNRRFTDLFDALHAWHRDDGEPFPRGEAAAAVAATIQRVVRVGVVGLLVALLPTALLVWQNILMAQQNAYLRTQQEQIQRQLELQGSEVELNQRFQLITAIYERAPCDKPRCPFASSPRVRQEAIEAYIVRSYKSGESTDLRQVIADKLDLSGLRLSQANLHSASLREASLNKAEMDNVNLGGADLFEASLRNVNLAGANLRKANLSGANLTGANLQGANLDFANLAGANLIRANLAEADLAEVNLQGATYDAETRWPNGFQPDARGARRR